ncbi:hypothetical protein [Actinomadura parmotrematis]|nr:hypothetical protein [Actinomadura parmotrematis]
MTEQGASGKQPISGAKGIAIVLGGMLAVMLVLWLLAYLVAP